jgi:hypothetical protein
MLSTDANLADAQNITLVLRVVFDSQGCLRHGQIIDINAELVGQFADRAGLIRALTTWFDAQGCPDHVDAE